MNIQVYMLYTVFILGAFVILSYIICLPRVLPDKSMDALWFGIRGTTRKVYYASMILTAIAFVASLWWLHNHFPKSSINILTQAYTVFLIGAVLWSVCLLLWGTTRAYTASIISWCTMVLVVLSLCMTSFGSAYLLYTVSNEPNIVVPTWVFVSLILVFIHVFLLDNIGWAYTFVMHTLEH